MKTHWLAENSNPHYWQWANEEMVGIPGFSGYYISRFLDIVSFRSMEGSVIKTHKAKNGKYTLQCVQLFDNNGKRHLLSVNKLYKDVLGVEEHARRAGLRLDRDEIVRNEKETAEKIRKDKQTLELEAFEKIRLEFLALGRLY
jgi:hypothetical protein